MADVKRFMAKVSAFAAAVVLLSSLGYASAEQVTAADTIPAPTGQRAAREEQVQNRITRQDCWVDVTVTDKAGNPVPGAIVEIKAGKETVGSGNVDETGRIRVTQISEGITYTLSASQQTCGEGKASYEASVKQGQTLAIKLPGEFPVQTVEKENIAWLILGIACAGVWLLDAACLIVGLVRRRRKKAVQTDGKYMKQ